ncbi:hypothetical protein HNQ88_004279 [Aureibacter tunicatorum]|uniref:Uncharacterized protein n=1 Tax=Aureibacter tunicatorum TaxID=866807 RepID=A0AAE3XR30_9BACT|nr:hypothetical protein [Aureibacter tunicatorum]BDD03978.1 hypothetical protein AUTU_14610 [Aureibacter tunicatorum]
MRLKQVHNFALNNNLNGILDTSLKLYIRDARSY